MSSAGATIDGVPPRHLQEIRRGRTQLPPPPRSGQRRAVEAALRGTTPSTAVSVAQLAERTGYTVIQIRSALNALVQIGFALNVCPHQLPALYCLGHRGRARSASGAPAPIRTIPEDRYDGKELRPYTGRPGAMRAFELPSLVDGRRVERARPTLISAPGEPTR